MIRFVLLMLVTILISACSILGLDSRGCKLPDSFTEADLIGTWVERKLDLAQDTLIFREDSFYKQIIHLESIQFDYESDWLPWRIEYSDLGVPYLYLEEYRPYAFNPDFIESELVGGGSGYWWDFCRKGRLEMPPGVGVLIVSGVPARFKQPPRGFQISFPGRSPENSSWTYTFEEP